MDNVKVRVLNAVVDGNSEGSEIEINEASAKHLASIGYVELVAEESKPKAKAESAPTDAAKSAEKPKAQRKTTKDKNEGK